MPLQTSVLRSGQLPTGAQVIRRALVRNPQGQVTLHRTVFAGGKITTHALPIDTVNRGVLLPGWRIPGGPARFTPVLGPANKQAPVAVENRFQQTAASAPVGTKGALIAPLPAFARQGRLYGAPPRK